MSFEEQIAMAVLYRWQEANEDIEIWENKDENILLPFAQELYNDFLKEIKDNMDDEEDWE
tara:strand:+ start:507 stop:686 length:180 start_codon:yes stop_codon:yes gene_type:complete